MIGLCSVTFRDLSVEEVIRVARRAGLECIEWESRKHVRAGDLEEAKRVAGLTREAGLEISSYGTYYQVGSHENFEDIIETAKAMETKMIRVWAGEKSSVDADEQWFDHVVKDAERIADLAGKNELALSFEYHSGTLTDTPESARRLMEAVNKPNVYLYWQPAETLTTDERLESLAFLSPYIFNVHVFHWQDYKNRYELSEGEAEWNEYVTVIEENTHAEHHYLLEFVKNDDPKQLIKDAEVLRSLLKSH